MTEIRDLDKELPWLAATDESAHIPTKPLKMMGREWHIRCDVNSYTVSEILKGDAIAIAGFIRNLIVEDERADFSTALGAVPNLGVEQLVDLLNVFVGAAGDRPTEPPSTSRTTASKRTSGRKSTAGSSSVRAVRSAR